MAEATRQLSDEGVYVALDKDPTSDMSKKVNNRLRKARDDGNISESTLEYILVNTTAKAGRVYLLPNMHKGVVQGDRLSQVVVHRQRGFRNLWTIILNHWCPLFHRL